MGVLQMVFGLTSSVLGLWLKFGIKLLFKILSREPLAKVCFPPEEEIEEFIARVNNMYPAINGVWCTMDGLKIPIQCSGDYKTQNAYYNGWLHAHLVGCVFAFAPSGLIVAASVNNPGMWHDSFIAENSGLYEKLNAVFQSVGGKCVVDSAFSARQYAFLVKSAKTVTPNLTNAQIQQNVQATSLRQTAEWGMRALQGSFPRLKDKIAFTDDHTDRKLLLSIIPLLFNFRTNFLGINQITSHFYPLFEMQGDHPLDFVDLNN
jgi:hypothetical protein